MLVVIDIRDTNITIGIYHGDKLIGNYRLTTKMERTGDEYRSMVTSFLDASKVQPADIKDVIVSSVVPKIMRSFLNGVHRCMHKGPILVGPRIKTGISVKAGNPKAVGAGHIVDVTGTYYEYGGPYLVVGYGTATAFGYVDANGNFEYGVITLGIETGARAMWTQAAELPEIEIKKLANILAKTTTTSMQAGLVYGYIGQSKYIVKEFKRVLGVDMKVIAIDGLEEIIYKNADGIDIYDRDLAFKGLKYIYGKYTTEKKKQINVVKKLIPWPRAIRSIKNVK